MKLDGFIIVAHVAWIFASCATKQVHPAEHGNARVAESQLRAARIKSLPRDQRIALFLSAADHAIMQDGNSLPSESARRAYNKAAAELVVYLRSIDEGEYWNQSQSVSAEGAGSYQIHFAQPRSDGTWDPSYFTSFTQADQVPKGCIKRKVQQQGLGGALVGVRKKNPLEPNSPWVGITAPVTATLDFRGGDATISLVDPTKAKNARIGGSEHPLNADFTSPLAYYPQKNEWWEGIMGAIRVSQYMGTTGLYTLQPYDSKRIPVILIHGLISTARMWRNVINELEMDPRIRDRFQFWVFAYPTGNPPAYSALRLREELAKFEKIHPDAPGYVLVGHSMGGIIARMQATTIARSSWDGVGNRKGANFLANVRQGSLVDRALVFEANPHVDRVVFICTPHHGSEMALGSLGEIGRRLISLPVDLTASVTASLGNSLTFFTGDPRRMPNSVIGLSPSNPMLKVLNSNRIKAPFHSIIGDRGKGDSPDSSDGVVGYWSSHLAGARSEQIVPGPHGSCELPETINELRRILLLHLRERRFLE